MNRSISIVALASMATILGCQSREYAASSPQGTLDTKTFSTVVLAVDDMPMETSPVLPSGTKVRLTCKLRFNVPRTIEEIQRLKSMPYVEVSLQSGEDPNKVARAILICSGSTDANTFEFSGDLIVPSGEGTMLMEASTMDTVEERTPDGQVAFRAKSFSPFHRVAVTLD